MMPLYSRPYEWMFRHVLYPLYEEHLRGRKTLQWVREMVARDQWSVKQLEVYRLECLKQLLCHARDQVPWYREQMAKTGLVPEDMTRLSQLSVLPVLTKDIVREHYDDLIAHNCRNETFSKVTGGSTGSPFRFEITRADYERRMAVMWRGYGRAGARMGRRTLYLWGADILPRQSVAAWKDHIYHCFFQRRMLNSFELTRDNLSEYLKAIRKYRPEVIVAYVSPLYQLACYMLDHGRALPDPPTSVLTGAEPLHEFQRQIIEKAFCCPVYNTYGCREFMLVASEAPGVEGMLINADQVFLETLDSEKKPALGQSGDLLITDLHARGMPLIRYSNGDMATLAPTGYRPHGYPWPVLTSVDGRRLDVIRTVSGGLLPGEFFPHLMKDIPGISQFQVIQKRLDQVIIRVVPSVEFSEGARTRLDEVVRKYLGDGMALVIECVDDIPLSPSGKRRVTISEIEA